MLLVEWPTFSSINKNSGLFQLYIFLKNHHVTQIWLGQTNDNDNHLILILIFIIFMGCLKITGKCQHSCHSDMINLKYNLIPHTHITHMSESFYECWAFKTSSTSQAFFPCGDKKEYKPTIFTVLTQKEWWKGSCKIAWLLLSWCWVS